MINVDKKYKFLTGIYKLIINEHVYVGSSVDLYKRLRRHYRDLLRNKHDNYYLQRAFNKYGEDYLQYEVLEILDNVTHEELLVREKYFIDLFQADLNLKLDPVTQQNCITTSVKVFQFNLYGEFIKE